MMILKCVIPFFVPQIFFSDLKGGEGGERQH